MPPDHLPFVSPRATLEIPSLAVAAPSPPPATGRLAASPSVSPSAVIQSVVSPSASQSFSQSVSPSVRQSARQSVSQSVSQSVRQSVNHAAYGLVAAEPITAMPISVCLSIVRSGPSCAGTRPANRAPVSRPCPAGRGTRAAAGQGVVMHMAGSRVRACLSSSPAGLGSRVGVASFVSSVHSASLGLLAQPVFSVFFYIYTSCSSVVARPSPDWFGFLNPKISPHALMYDERFVSSERPSFAVAVVVVVFAPFSSRRGGTVQSAVGQLVGPGQSLAVVSIGAKPPGQALFCLFLSSFLG